MPLFAVPIENAVAIRRKKGVTLVLQNLSATDVFLSSDPGQLNNSLASVAPSGLKLVNTTGLIQIQNFPGVIWARAAAATTIIVDP